MKNENVCFERKIKLSFSRLRNQLYIIRDFALRTNFEKHEVANFWPIFPQYIGMRFLPLHGVSASKIWILLKIKNVNVTSKFVNCDSKIHLHQVSQIHWHWIRRNLGMFTNIYSAKWKRYSTKYVFLCTWMDKDYKRCLYCISQISSWRLLQSSSICFFLYPCYASLCDWSSILQIQQMRMRRLNFYGFAEAVASVVQ